MIVVRVINPMSAEINGRREADIAEYLLQELFT